jgi:protein PhnA
MSLEELMGRSSGQCELCGSTESLRGYTVEPRDDEILICATCAQTIDNPTENEAHWHCLNDSMWSTESAVQVMAYRLLNKLGKQDMLDMLYLEIDVQEWADAGLDIEDENSEPTRDSNGNILAEGDSVTIIKDLPVKGAGFTAKQGTTVKNIKMAPGDPTHIQGRVNGTMIFLKTEFLKKA